MPSKKKPLTLGEWADRRVCWLLSGVYDALSREFAIQREVWRWSKGRRYPQVEPSLKPPKRPSEEDFPPK